MAVYLVHTTQTKLIVRSTSAIMRLPPQQDLGQTKDCPFALSQISTAFLSLVRMSQRTSTARPLILSGFESKQWAAVITCRRPYSVPPQETDVFCVDPSNLLRIGVKKSVYLDVNWNSKLEQSNRRQRNLRHRASPEMVKLARDAADKRSQLAPASQQPPHFSPLATNAKTYAKDGHTSSPPTILDGGMAPGIAPDPSLRSRRADAHTATLWGVQVGSEDVVVATETTVVSIGSSTNTCCTPNIWRDVKVIVDSGGVSSQAVCVQLRFKLTSSDSEKRGRQKSVTKQTHLLQERGADSRHDLMDCVMV